MSATPTAPPVLESGDHLTRDEFHQRYCARPDIKKAELVEGVVYVPSPLRFELDSEPHGRVITWLGVYTAKHPAIRLGDNPTVRLDATNEVQPDACLWQVQPDGPRLDARGYVEGAPQLVVEIAASSASYDLHEKKEAYRRNGVREYVVWRVLDRAMDWFRLQAGEFIRVAPDARGVIESAAFPGLRLDVPKLLTGDLAGVLAALD